MGTFRRQPRAEETKDREQAGAEACSEFDWNPSSPSSPKLRELRGGGCQALSRLALDSHWNASRTAPPSSGSLRQSSCLWAEVHEASLHSEESWSPVPHLSPSTLCLFTLLATSSSLPFLRLSGPSCHHYYQRCNYYVPANDDPLAATLLKFCL